MMFPIDSDGFMRRENAIAVGFDRRALARALARGEVDEVAAGVYALPDARTPSAEHAARVLAASTPPRTVISYASAAVLHGVDMLQPDLGPINLTSTWSGRGYRRPRRHLHPGPLTAAEVVEVRGRWATSLERTVFDVARSSEMGFPGALAAVDMGLRAGADPAVLAEYAMSKVAGVGVFRRALLAADPLSENPGESWGRAQIIEAGLSIPTLQRCICDPDGAFVARTDYDWADADGEVRLVGEFDGLAKYLKYLAPGENPRDVIAREKRREGRLQDLGIVVVRWTWEDLRNVRLVPRLVEQMQAVGLAVPEKLRTRPSPFARPVA